MDKKEFLVEDYKMKVDFFANHFSRVWMRFNFFLAIQGASIGFGLKELIENKGKLLQNETALYFLLNIGICLIWYMFGAQDRFLTILYRKQSHYSGKLCAEEFELPGYEPVGTTENTSENVTPNYSIIQWRSSLMSMTKLPAIVPIVFSLCWIMAAISYYCGA